MARHLFIAQQTLATWMDQDKIEFEDNVMTIKADGRAFKLVEAVRFVKVEGDEEDKTGLLGRVKTNSQLEEMGAERYRDSVILQDIAYRVQEGFIGEVFLRQDEKVSNVPGPAESPADGRETPARNDLEKKKVARPAAQASAQPPQGRASPLQARVADATKPESDKKKEGEPSDEELLTRFLLDNL